MASPTDILIAHNRFGYGLGIDESPARDPRQWLAWQLGAFDANPTLIVANPGGSLPDLFERLTSEDKITRRAFYDAHRLRIWQRAETARLSPTPFVERLVHFWANHFAVSAGKKAVMVFAASFEFDAIRPNVTGNFADLLMAAETHPAMLVYLDQTRSIGPGSPVGLRRGSHGAKNRGLNENLAREILELHTMGARSGYTQGDVEALARALTGYTATGIQSGLPAGGPALGRFVFDRQRHEPGARRFLGRSFAQSGAEQARTMLAAVVNQPATARFVATKLARHFIADEPSSQSVERLADAFTRSQGDLPTVYRALIEDEAIWRPGRAKFKSPWEWIVSALRTAGIALQQSPWLAHALADLGQKTWEPSSPAGYADTRQAWLAPDALARRADAGLELARRSAEQPDARAIADHAYLGELASETQSAIAAAGDPSQGLSLYLMSPEFLWR